MSRSYPPPAVPEEPFGQSKEQMKDSILLILALACCASTASAFTFPVFHSYLFFPPSPPNLFLVSAQSDREVWEQVLGGIQARHAAASTSVRRGRAAVASSLRMQVTVPPPGWGTGIRISDPPPPSSTGSALSSGGGASSCSRGAGQKDNWLRAGVQDRGRWHRPSPKL